MKTPSFLAGMLLVVVGTLQAQPSPKILLAEVNKKFSQVKDYSAELNMLFNIPAVRLEPVSGKVFYKSPDKFRIKADGIVFLPRQNPYFTLESIRDTNAFTALSSGEELIGAVKTKIIQIIPNDNSGELIIAKLWIDATQRLILKSQLTTRSNGTITVEQYYGAQQAKALPDKIKFTIDVARFKIPKSMAVDLNSSSKSQNLPAKGAATIQLVFSNYKLNQKLSDAVFAE